MVTTDAANQPCEHSTQSVPQWGHGRRDNPASHPFGMDHDAHPFNKARLVALALVSAIHDTTIY
ncbi:hypothetical protein KB1253_12290 [Lactiplantibacillus plantarum]|nr:putative MarR family transcriptional regulator [Lactiplantibacillus plantarum]GEL32350.1 hypothetical protein LPL02_00890 [Lactiplantibacillus plantarum subsp. plantarum]BEI46961.1 hypothetical protein IYO2065_14650 [Lactiplantibacillus plantarum]BEI50095.1 hypothetical protein AWA2013_15010 [Lactiplantibacillus plantarum]BEI53306.1 hypothetical protein AWA2045_14370 [Lactiplantibacillus plantarum]